MPLNIPFVGYRADCHDGMYRVYISTDLNVARAYAAKRELQTGTKWSVYRVEPEHPLEDDPDYPHFRDVFRRCVTATPVEVLEKRPTMTPLDSATYILDHYMVWRSDGSPMYADGYPTASPNMRAAGLDHARLRHLGRYADPEQVDACAASLAATGACDHS